MRPPYLSGAAVLVVGCAAFASCRYATSLDEYSTEYGLVGGSGGEAGSEQGGAGGLGPEGGGGTATGGTGLGGAGGKDADKPETDVSAPEVLPDVPLDLPDQGNCTPGRLDCDGNEGNGCEVDGNTDSNNCGACGHKCYGGKCESQTCKEVLLAEGQNVPWGIAVDNTAVYWSNQGSTAANGEINSLNLNGGTPQNLAKDQGNPGDIALDTTAVYWSNYTSGGSIMKVNKTGGGIVPISGGNGPWSVAVDTVSVYWTNTSGQILKAPIGGGSSTVVSSGEDEPRGIALDGDNVLWTAAGAGKLVQAKKSDGSSKTDVVPPASQAYPLSLFVDSDALYWTNVGSSFANGACSASDGKVMKLVKGQTNPVTLAQEQACPMRVVVRDHIVYWTNAGTFSEQNYAYNGAVMKVPANGGTPTAVAAAVVTPFGIAVDANCVYWTTQGLGANTGAIKKIVRN